MIHGSAPNVLEPARRGRKEELYLNHFLLQKFTLSYFKQKYFDNPMGRDLLYFIRIFPKGPVKYYEHFSDKNVVENAYAITHKEMQRKSILIGNDKNNYFFIAIAIQRKNGEYVAKKEIMTFLYNHRSNMWENVVSFLNPAQVIMDSGPWNVMVRLLKKEELDAHLKRSIGLQEAETLILAEAPPHNHRLRLA